MSEEEKQIQVQDKDVIVAKIVLKGDLSALKPREKVQYYNELCHALGLNPLTRPFEYIRLQGQEVLYANKSATEQLRKKYRVSVIEKTESQPREDVYVVTVKVEDSEGRTDIASGAIELGKGISASDFANLLMKAETKAKRRATLSICGLGMIDETELETTAAQYVTDDELNKARSSIMQLFEDNEQYLAEDYRTSTQMDVDYAIENHDITGLENIYQEVKDEITKAKRPEIKEATKESFAKSAKEYAQGDIF